MRTTFIVTYDICHPKRLRKVFKTCQGYGNHLQYSVFECDLNPSEKADLESRLHDIINAREDQVLFISLGPAENRGERVITALGKVYSKFDEACYVV